METDRIILRPWRDSDADICFVACCAMTKRLIPALQIPAWLWIWAGVIVAIKFANQVSRFFGQEEKSDQK